MKRGDGLRGFNGRGKINTEEDKERKTTEKDEEEVGIKGGKQC